MGQNGSMSVSTHLPQMPVDQSLLDEIRDINLAYLMLAQRMLRQDFAEGCARLGLGAQAAQWLLAMSTAQLLAVAQRGELLCRMRIDDELVWGLLSGRCGSGLGASPSLSQRLHASVLLAAPERCS
jgi:flagellar transcriptional activator FlhD